MRLLIVTLLLLKVVIGSAYQMNVSVDNEYSEFSLGTIEPQPNFNPNADAQALKKALKGIGTDTNKLTSIVASRTNFERQKIAEEYKTVAKRNLVDHIKSDTSGNYEDILVALMTPAAEYDAYLVHQAIKGFGTDFDLLLEVMLTRSPRQLKGLASAFKRIYKKDMTEAIKGDTSGEVQQLLVQLSQANRDESETTDFTQAKRDAENLYKSGLKPTGTGGPVFNEILATRNYRQLNLIFDEYQKMSRRSIEDSIKAETSGKLQKTLLIMVGCIRDPATHFAEVIHHAVKGIGTNEKELIRVLTTRSEVDLAKIKMVYAQKYGRDLEKAIRRDVHGKFQDVMVALVRGNKK